MVKETMTTLTDGLAVTARLLSARVPDAMLVSGAVCFGVGVWEFDPRAVWLYSGAVLSWMAFGLAASRRAR